MPRYPTSSAQPRRTRQFSFYLFWLVFWLTVVATLLMSWQLLVVPADWSPFAPIPEAIPTPTPSISPR